MPTQDKQNKGLVPDFVTPYFPKGTKAKKMEPGTGPLKPGTTKADAKKQMDKNTANKKATPKPAVKVDANTKPKDVVKPKPKGGTYASAKKKDPKLDSYIKARNSAKKGSSDYNAAQNKINSAYGKGPTDKKVTVADGTKTSTGVMAPKAETKTKAEKITDTGIPKDVKAPKPKTAMEKAKEAIASGDKKAARKSGLKGKTKRVAKKLAKGVDKAKKEATKEKQLAELRSAASPTTFKSFDQMDSKNAMATAGEGPMEMKAPMEMKTSPINYFKQSIKYDIKEATNPNLTSSARKHYSMNAEAGMKSPGKMVKAPATMSKAPTQMQGAKRKGGSILSKHMKS
jgi:hypothetical protein